MDSRRLSETLTPKKETLFSIPSRKRVFRKGLHRAWSGALHLANRHQFGYYTQSCSTNHRNQHYDTPWRKHRRIGANRFRAGGNFINEETVTKLQLPRTELRHPVTLRNVDETKNHKGLITHRTILEITIANKRQWISLLITGLGKQKIILGLPWLVKENPDIDWQHGTLQWRPAPLVIVGNNDDNEGGDFTNYTISLAETYKESEENDSTTLKILKVKISNHFNQIYRDQDKKKVEPEELVPKAYHQYLKLFSKPANIWPRNSSETRLQTNSTIPLFTKPCTDETRYRIHTRKPCKRIYRELELRNGFTSVLCRKEKRIKSTLSRLPKTQWRYYQGRFPSP
jgi:hypothetical protein